MAQARCKEPEPFGGLLKSYFMEDGRKWEKNQMVSYWKNTPAQMK